MPQMIHYPTYPLLAVAMPDNQNAAPRSVRVLGIAGSLRAGSFNRALLRTAQEIAPAGMAIDIFDLAPIPLYNADVEAKGDPDPVAALKTAIRGADVLLIATPEYNYGMPGVLKNAIDWASRPPATMVLKGKPVGIIGASPSMMGTVRSQLQLRQVLFATRSRVMLEPELLVAKASEKFDQQGKLTDEAARKVLAKHLAALVEWTERFIR